MKTKNASKWTGGQSWWQPGAMGLLLCLAAGPLSVSGQGVISSSSTTGADLDSLFGPPTNSVIVVAGVTISNPGGSDAVTGSSVAWNLTNHATINGVMNGVNFGMGGSVANYGSITASGNDGVNLGGSGSVNNFYGGMIMGGANNGVEIQGATGAVTNAGTIIGGGSGSDGVMLFGNGTVYNQAGGIIQGGQAGVYFNADGNVINAGTITGINQYGVYINDMNNQDWVNNLPGGVIQSGGVGVYLYWPGAVTNAGTISGAGGDGVYLNSNGANGSSVVNQNGGFIGGSQNGVEIDGPGTVINAGTIIGTNGTALLLGNYNNSVTLQTGSVVGGNIVGGTATDAAYLQGHGSYSSNFLNFETLTVQGDASATGWNLSGNNTFATSATVQSGLLLVNGRLTSPLISVANSAGGLGGSGTIFGTVDNQGYFAPGNNGIGTLTIMGSLTNAGNYYADVNAAGNSDHIRVSGTATIIGGSVIAQPASGTYGFTTVYDILTATNGIIGGFTGASSLGALTSATLSNDLDNVYLVLHGKSFLAVASTYNQTAVAGALDGIGNAPGSLSNLVTGILAIGTVAQAQQALESLSGDIHGTLGILDVQQQNAFNGAIAQRTGRISASGQSGEFASTWKPVQLASTGSDLPVIQQAAPNRPLDVWLQGVGSFGNLQGDGNALGGNYAIGGMSGGLDYRVTPSLLVGLGLGYSQDNADVGGPGGNGKVNDYQAAVYTGYVRGPWHLDGIFSYGLLHTESSRLINVSPNLQQLANGNYNGGVIALSSEGGYAFQFKWLTVEPTLGLNYAHLSQNGFSETGTASDGNNYGLNVNSVKLNSVRSALGVRLAAQFGKPGAVQIIPSLHALWEHEFADRYADVNASLLGGSGNFDVRGVELGADTALLGGGLTVAFNRRIQGFLNYDADLNAQLKSSTVSGGLSISW